MSRQLLLYYSVSFPGQSNLYSRQQGENNSTSSSNIIFNPSAARYHLTNIIPECSHLGKHNPLVSGTTHKICNIKVTITKLAAEEVTENTSS